VVIGRWAFSWLNRCSRLHHEKVLLLKAWKDRLRRSWYSWSPEGRFCQFLVLWAVYILHQIAFFCSGLSRASSWPFVIIQILSASSSASSRCYELMMIDLPTLILLISSQTCLLDSISRPEVGSSKMITLGLVTIAMAKDSFLFIPPERCTTLFCACSVSITTSKVLVIVCCIKFVGMSFNSQTK